MRHFLLFLSLVFTNVLFAQVYPIDFPQLPIMTNDSELYEQREAANGQKYGVKYKAPVLKAYVRGSGNDALITQRDFSDSLQNIRSLIDKLYLIPDGSILGSITDATGNDLALNDSKDTLWIWKTDWIPIAIGGSGGGSSLWTEESGNLTRESGRVGINLSLIHI